MLITILSLFAILNIVDSNALIVQPWKDHVGNIKCSKEFLKFSADFHLSDVNFRLFINDRYDETVYRSIPVEIGKWAELHFLENKTPFVLVVENDQLVKHSFDEGCRKTVENDKWPNHFEKALAHKMSEDWKNDDLKNMLLSKDKGIIYSWSPKFPYSVLALPQVERVARKMGFKFTAVVDPRATREEILSSIKTIPNKMVNRLRNLASLEKFNRNISTDLFLRNAFNHYPITYVYSNGKIHPRFVTGVMTDEGLKQLMLTYASELK